MSRELKGWTRPRPLRVAFLIENGIHANLALDGIFADCYGRWGGRFSLIVPCLDGHIAASYWPWLEAYDPDIVYSYVPLSKDDVLEVHERLSPFQYAYHELGHEPRLDVFGFKPSYDFRHYLRYLSSSSWLDTAQGLVMMRQLKLSTVGILNNRRGFLTDNLGTYHQSRAKQLSANLQQLQHRWTTSRWPDSDDKYQGYPSGTASVVQYANCR